LLGFEPGQDRKNQTASAKLEAKGFEEVWRSSITVGHIVYDAHCIAHSI
jgi:hypothetical protein